MLNRRHIAMNENIENIKPVHLDFISPTPAQAATHQMEITHVKLLNQFHPRITASWRAIPAPQHLIKINELPADHKKYTLPIVPNTDFIPARQGSGPAPSHCYDKPIEDLRFVVIERPLSGKAAVQITGRSSLDSCSCHIPETARSRSIRSPSHCDTQDWA